MKLDEVMGWFSSSLVCASPSTRLLLLVGGRGTRLRSSPDPAVRATPKLMAAVRCADARMPMIGVARGECEMVVAC